MARDGVALDERFDERFDPPTPEQLRGEIAGVALAENGNPDHGPFILFRALCGDDGYYCAASFRDPVGYGGGATPREALMSLARSLRDTSDKVIAAARPACSCDLRATDGHQDPPAAAEVDSVDPTGDAPDDDPIQELLHQFWELTIGQQREMIDRITHEFTDGSP